MKKYLLLSVLLLPAPVVPAQGAVPAVVHFLETKGLKLDSRFAAPGGLTGYVGTTPQGRRIVFYVPRDGSVALFGHMVNAHGQDLTAEHLRRYVRDPEFAAAFKVLQSTHWIGVGAKNPRHVIYAFVDPNCPYCHRLWQVAGPAAAQGVQMRYIIVGILGPSSSAKAAAILAARDPARALATNERRYRIEDGGIKPLPLIPKALKAQLDSNVKLMLRFELNGTPGMVWKNSRGEIQTSNGLPPAAVLKKIFSVASPDTGS